MLFCLAVKAPAQDAAMPAPAATDAGVAVQRFEFSYGLEHPELPPLEELQGLTIRSTRDGTVFRAPSTAGAENLTLSGLPEGSRFDSDALRGVAEEVVRWYNARGLYGVWVTYADLESSASGVVDNRPADNHTARMVIWASQVAEVRTLARGKRFKPQSSVNNRKHRGIISHSPLQPGATPEQPGSLFRQDVLNDYLRGLSLHPGRLVEASIASAGAPGKVVLDYLVNESKSWQVFSQVTNFGTESTGVWRGRLGFQHNQLTNHDDIFNIDAISTPDAKTYGSFLSYRIPLWRPAKLLVRVYGSYGDFLASDASLLSLRFAGRNWLGGIEFTNRLALPRNWQLVSSLGANYNHYAIQSRIVSTNADGEETGETPLVTGFSNFLIPFFSTNLSKDTDWWSLASSVRYDQTVGSFANTDQTSGIPALGRSSADSEWRSLRWSVGGMIYLEPLFQGRDDYRYLANQLSVRVKGRILLKPGDSELTGARLIPHEEEPIGGASSVRGYPESILSADEFISASIEYAVHFPRLLKPGERGKLFGRDFKRRPTRGRQNPDWDLVGRVFYDFAHRQVTPLPLQEGQDPTAPVSLAETSVNLAGAGGGIELLVKQNFSLRCEVGMALTELRDNTLEEDKRVVYPAGEFQYYVSTSFSW